MDVDAMDKIEEAMNRRWVDVEARWSKSLIETATKIEVQIAKGLAAESGKMERMAKAQREEKKKDILSLLGFHHGPDVGAFLDLEVRAGDGGHRGGQNGKRRGG